MNSEDLRQTSSLEDHFETEKLSRLTHIAEVKRKEEELRELLNRKNDWLKFRRTQVLKLGATANDKTRKFDEREAITAAVKIQRRWRLFSASQLLIQKRMEAKNALKGREGDNTRHMIPFESSGTHGSTRADKKEVAVSSQAERMEEILKSLRLRRADHQSSPNETPPIIRHDVAQRLLDAHYETEQSTEDLSKLIAKVVELQKYIQGKFLVLRFHQ
ncbi:hypothetical protein HDU93_001831 [Gonapodya sp. JEL0774]|nr:hypothetical protein HDU93_001831 [Gonapodya sp. JEL0774]